MKYETLRLALPASSVEGLVGEVVTHVSAEVTLTLDNLHMEVVGIILTSNENDVFIGVEGDVNYVSFYSWTDSWGAEERLEDFGPAANIVLRDHIRPQLLPALRREVNRLAEKKFFFSANDIERKLDALLVA